jgi:RNA polymerase sigma factor (TIGR02999 family)
MAGRPEVTDLLAAVAGGDEGARETLFERVYDELKRIARGQMRRSGEWLSINPTTLLHEAWIKFDRADSRPLAGSLHFYNVLAQAMRQILVDMARSHGAQRRGGGFVHTDLTERIEQPEKSADDLLAVDAALGKLQACDADLAQLVEWHFFGGISFVDIASVRGVTERTVRRHWELARIFLANAIGAAPAPA